MYYAVNFFLLDLGKNLYKNVIITLLSMGDKRDSKKTARRVEKVEI